MRNRSLFLQSRRREQKTYKGTLVKNATVNREISMLKTMFSFAVEWGWIEVNAARKVRKLRGEQKRLRILTKKEIGRLLSEAPEHLKPILVTAISTGMRYVEILKLEWRNLDFDNGFIRVENAKNGECRIVPMDAHLESILLKLRKSGKRFGHVFTRDDDRKIRSVKEAFRAACKRAGIEDFRFHDLRHTAASLLAAGRCDIITLQNVLGHKTLSMTQRYAHLIPERHEKTKKITQKFWGGDTKSDTVEKSGKEDSLSL